VNILALTCVLGQNAISCGLLGPGDAIGFAPNVCLAGEILRGPQVAGEILRGPLVGGEVIRGPELDGEVIRGPELDGEVVIGPLLTGGVIGKCE